MIAACSIGEQVPYIIPWDGGAPCLKDEEIGRLFALLDAVAAEDFNIYVQMFFIQDLIKQQH